MGGGKGEKTMSRSAMLNKFKAEADESMHGLLQLLDSPAPSGTIQVTKKQCMELSDKVSKEATKVAIFWNTSPKDVGNGILVMKELSDSVSALLIHLHGSTIDAGKTLLTGLKSASANLVDSVLGLIRGAIESSSKGFDPAVRQTTLPKLAGRVWEACETIKKSPPNNRSAIGRTLATYASSVKDVVREIGEMNSENDKNSKANADENENENEEKHSSLDSNGNGKPLQPTETSEEQKDGDEQNQNESVNGEEAEEDEFNFSLSLEDDYTEDDMEVIRASKDMCYDIFLLIKQLVYVVAKWPDSIASNSNSSVELMEKILGMCKEISFHVDEIGASLYPPQEVTTLKTRSIALDKIVDDLEALTLSAEMHSELKERVNCFQKSSKKLMNILDAL